MLVWGFGVVWFGLGWFFFFFSLPKEQFCVYETLRIKLCSLRLLGLLPGDTEDAEEASRPIVVYLQVYFLLLQFPVKQTLWLNMYSIIVHRIVICLLDFRRPRLRKE